MTEMTRRGFLGGAGALGASALTGCLTGDVASAPRPEPAFVWGALLHLGSNMWRDWTPDGVYPKSLEEERRMVAEGKISFTSSRLYCNRDYMSADMDSWNRQVACVRDEGLNAVFVDVGEAFAYPSHPELWVKGAFDAGRMAEEVTRLRGLGLEPIPKLNFSTGHDQWLREYHCQTSSAKYRQVVADVIRDTCEAFGSPRYFHLGFDEEIFASCGRRELCIMRQGDAWWRDFLFCVGEVERHGSRAMLWSDKICGGREEFLRRMPKSVLQVPWYYGKDFSDRQLAWRAEFEKSQKWDIQTNLAAALVVLAEAGYDLMPCTSNWSCDEAADAMLGFCRKRIDPSRLKGFFTAPWRKPVPEDDAKALAGIRLFAAAKRRHYA